MFFLCLSYNYLILIFLILLFFKNSSNIMGFYRKSLLFIQGLMRDTKSGYDEAARCFDNSDLEEDLTGIEVLVTGANSGIGYETAKAIAERGGTVHLVCRNQERAERSRSEIVNATGNKSVFVHILDLSRVCEVTSFARAFAANHGKLDILINNAGEMRPRFERSEGEGHELTFATNVLGPVVLTMELLPLLKNSPNFPRVVNVGSAGMLLQRLNVNYFDADTKFDGILAYAQCKRQLAIMTEKWALDHPEIHFSCMHPGWVDTPAARRGLGDFYEKMKEKFRKAKEGADTVVWLAISKPSLSTKSGLFFQDRKPISKHLPFARTKESKAERTKLFRIFEEMDESPTSSTQNSHCNSL